LRSPEPWLSLCLVRPTRQARVCEPAENCDIRPISNKELVIGLLSRLPEDTPLVEIAREIKLLAGLRVAREQARRCEGIAAEDARKLVEGWAGR
jgi:hypothetical protein